MNENKSEKCEVAVCRRMKDKWRGCSMGECPNRKQYTAAASGSPIPVIDGTPHYRKTPTNKE